MRTTPSHLSIVLLLAAMLAYQRSVEPDARASGHQPVVTDLIALLDSRPDLRDGLTQAIDAAGVQGIDSLDASPGRAAGRRSTSSSHARSARQAAHRGPT